MFIAKITQGIVSELLQLIYNVDLRVVVLSQMFLKELAEETGGRYHCYVSTSDVSIQDKWLMFNHSLKG